MRDHPSIANLTSSRDLVSALSDSGWSSKETTTKAGKVSLKNSIRGAANSLSEGSFKNSAALDSFREEREKEREMRKRKLELAKARRKRYSEVAETWLNHSESSSSFPQINFDSSFVQSNLVSSTSTPTVSSPFLKPTFKRFTAFSSTVTLAPPSETPRFAILTASSSSRPVPSSSIRSNLVSSTSTRTLSSSVINFTSSSSPKKKKGEPGWKKFDLQETSSSLSVKPSALSRSDSKASLLSPPPALSCQVSARVANPVLLTAARSPSVSTSNLPSTSVPKEQSVIEKLPQLPSAPTTPFSNLLNNSIKSKGAAITQM
ncbi:hypothetical protein JCM5350_004154 [Sporobolomyces pararoseus]